MISRRRGSGSSSATTGWRPILTLLLGLLVGSGTVAERLVLKLEPGGTQITFMLDATMHTVRGSARLAEGEIAFASEGGPASGLVVIDATSLETGKPSRDRKMHRKVLDSETHPEIRLEILATEGALAEEGATTLVLVSRLELAGEAHPIRIEAEVLRRADPSRSDRVEFTARFEVPYVEWGLRDPSTFVLRVAKVVAVTIEGQAALDDPP